MQCFFWGWLLVSKEKLGCFMASARSLFPHQRFWSSPGLASVSTVYLSRHPVLFTTILTRFSRAEIMEICPHPPPHVGFYPPCVWFVSAGCSKARKVIEDKQRLKTGGNRAFALRMRFQGTCSLCIPCNTARLVFMKSDGCCLWWVVEAHKWGVYSSYTALSHIRSKGQGGHFTCPTAHPKMWLTSVPKYPVAWWKTIDPLVYLYQYPTVRRPENILPWA